MNEPAIKIEEQIVSLFPDRETFVCRGWILKKMDGYLVVYPLYYKFSQGDIRCYQKEKQFMEDAENERAE